MLRLFGFTKNDDEVMLPESTFSIDGYRFGNRLLEGVMFDVVFDDKKILSCVVEERSATYFSGLNVKKWLKEAKNSAQDILDHGGDEINVSTAIQDKYPQYIGFFIAEEK